MALPVEAKPLISDEERELRRRLISSAIHSNRIEGQRHPKEIDPVIELYINGEIQEHEIADRVKLVLLASESS